MFKKNKKIVITILAGLVFYLINIFLLLYFESKNNSTLIKDFGDAVWYSIVTIASVGYGDKFPITLFGKFIGSVFVIGSIFTLTILIGRFSDYVTNLRERKKMGFNGTDFKNHFIILGWNAYAKSIVQILVDAGNHVVAITNNKEDIDIMIESFNKEKFFALYSDYNNYKLFEKANIADARLLFVNLVDDTDKLVSILNLKRLYSNLKFMVSLNNTDLKETFESAGVTYLVSRDEIASKLIASYIFEPGVAKFNIDILSDSRDEDDYDIQQFKVTNSFQLPDRTIGALNSLIKSKGIRALVVAINKGDNELIKIPDDDVIMNNGDYVLFILNGKSAKEIGSLFKVKQGV